MHAGHCRTHDCSEWSDNLRIMLSHRDPNMGEDGRWVPSSGGSYWPVYSPTNREYLSLQAGSYLRKSALRSQECHFWSSYLPQLLRKGPSIVNTSCHQEVPLILLFSAEEPLISKKGNVNPCSSRCSCPGNQPRLVR